MGGPAITTIGTPASRKTSLQRPTLGKQTRGSTPACGRRRNSCRRLCCPPLMRLYSATMNQTRVGSDFIDWLRECAHLQILVFRYEVKTPATIDEQVERR